MNVADDTRTVGQRLRQIRHDRGKSLRVLAGLAGISKPHLSRIERGERALDNRSETVALTNALQISPSELIGLPVPVPGDGHTDVAIRAVRAVLMAVGHHQPGEQVLPEALRVRVETLMAAYYKSRIPSGGAGPVLGELRPGAGPAARSPR